MLIDGLFQLHECTDAEARRISATLALAAPKDLPALTRSLDEAIGLVESVEADIIESRSTTLPSAIKKLRLAVRYAREDLTENDDLDRTWSLVASALADLEAIICPAAAPSAVAPKIAKAPVLA